MELGGQPADCDPHVLLSYTLVPAGMDTGEAGLTLSVTGVEDAP
jgi:hypothetical protein